jgi:uncharacterized protein (TIGR02453 family)
MAFKGWPAEAIEFYEGLEADNSKAYWLDHKAVYEQAVRAPMEALLADLAPEFGEGKIFRPFRDVRFSKDKSPYKTAMAASLSGGGYIQLSTNGLGVGSGMYQMESDQLQRYRSAIADEVFGGEVEAVIAKLAKRDISVSGHGELKTAPKGYPKDHPRIELLRYKGLVSWQEWPVGEWLGTGAAKKRLAEFLRACRPLNDWLTAHVGPTTLEASRRG